MFQSDWVMQRQDLGTWKSNIGNIKMHFRENSHEDVI
jgi:hypothetical protein